MINAEHEEILRTLGLARILKMVSANVRKVEQGSTLTSLYRVQKKWTKRRLPWILAPTKSKPQQQGRQFFLKERSASLGDV